MRNLIITGVVGTDAEIKVSKSGNSYVTFRLANNEYNEENTTWLSVVSHLPHFVSMAQYFKKGKQLIVTGHYSDEGYVSKTGKVEIQRTIRASSIEFMNNSSNRSQNDNSNLQQPTVSAQPTTPVVQNVTVQPTVEPQYTQAATLPTMSSPSVQVNVGKESDLPF